MPRRTRRSRRPKASTSRKWSGCHCPTGSRKISTKGRGRGWACQGNRPKHIRGHLKRVGARTIKRPFVKAVCGR